MGRGVPVGVAIDQAVESAKKYSSDEGPSFINGVLQNWQRRRRGVA